MKLFVLVCALLSVSSLALAHGDHSHGPALENDLAVKAATRMSQKMTIKDFGYSVGKLDQSWSKAKNVDYSVVEENEQMVVVAAHNSSVGKTIYFEMDSTGKVMAVR